MDSRFVCLLFMLVSLVESASVHACTDDSDCGTSEFCYLSTGSCTACVDCKAYQRQPAATCARDPAQCGECFRGFIPEILTNGHTRTLCIRAEEPPLLHIPTEHPATVQSANMSLGFICALAVGFCILLLFVASVVHKRLRQCLKIQWQTRFRQCNDSQTSLSCSFAPSAPPHAGNSTIYKDGTEERMFNHTFRYEREDEKSQQASKYLNPVWVRNNNNNNNPDEPTQDAVDGPVENAPFLIDENTLPSDWTPGEEYNGEGPTAVSSAEVPLVTSFAGILQLNALATAAPPPPGNHSAGPNGQDHHDTSGNAQGQQQFVVTNIVINNAAPSATGIFNITKT